MNLKQQLNRLERPARPDNRLPAAATPTAKRATVGLAPRSQAGIASPLAETDYADRTYFDQRSITSTDGIFTIEWTPLKTVDFNDANGSPVTLEFMEPV